MASPYKEVQTFTAKALRRILNASNPAAQKAALANLRRGVGHTPGDIPQLWGEFLLEMPEKMYGHGGQPSIEEWAVYTSLTLFSLHQQGHDPIGEPMHREGHSFGSAVGQLVTSDDEMTRILRRLNAAATADSAPALAHYLRGLIQLLRAQGIPLDYVSLAGDLYLYQIPEYTAQVRLSWGQDFYGYCYKNREDKEP